MLSLTGPGTAPAALKLDGLTSRVRYLVTCDCHHTISTFLCMSIPAAV